MARGEISYRITNMDRWVRATANPALFNAVMAKNMRLATELNGKVAEAAQRQVIQTRTGLKPNAPLTTFIKKSNKPVVHSGDLFQSITSQVIDDYTVFTGVKRTDEDFDIAKIVHEGLSINVTPAMRGMFFYLWKASIGEFEPDKLEGRAAQLWKIKQQGWKPLGPGTSAIVIPARPWVTIAFARSDFKEKILRNWHMALKLSFREMAGK